MKSNSSSDQRLRNIAVIPARGGSKRIPQKNIKLFHGKPVIGYSIEAALESGLFDKVIVSTDSDEIATVAEQFGAQTQSRRSEINANDHAPVVDAVLEAVHEVTDANSRFDHVCCLFATAPFITADTLHAGYQRLLEGPHNAIFTVKRHSFPIYRSLHYNDLGDLEMIWKQYQSTRSQDLPPTFHDAGQMYWITLDALLSQKSLYTDKSSGLELGILDCHDIDTLEDWAIAERLFTLNQLS